MKKYPNSTLSEKSVVELQSYHETAYGWLCAQLCSLKVATCCLEQLFMPSSLFPVVRATFFKLERAMF